MRIHQIMNEENQRLDPSCWTGYHKQGTKMKGGARVNNCVPNESVEEAALPWDGKAVVVYDATGAKILDTLDINTAAQKYGLNPLDIKNQLKVQSYTTMKGPKGSFIVSHPMVPTALDAKPGFTEDWNKVNKKDKTDGMSRKAVKAYRRENPGSKLKTAVTTKPSKLKKGGKAASRRKSFCARMSGMKKHRAGAKTKRDPDSPINKALRRWNCESIEQLQELVMIAEQKINEAKNPAQQAAIAISKKKEQGVAEGFPHDVDHMPGPVIRNADMTTDNVKTRDKAEWDRATDSINARVFDDMSEFRTDSKGETVVGDSAVWAKWDNATQTGWFNAKGRPLKPWPVKESGVAEGSGQKPTITYKDYTLQYDYQTEDDDPEGYSTATTYYFDVFKDGNRVGEAEYFDYFGDLTIRINGKTKKFEHQHPLASQVSQLVSSLPDEQKRDLSDPKFESQGVAEGSLEEYGDTAMGQKMLGKVQKRAVDRVIKADDKNRLEPDVAKRDLKTVRKNVATADRAWERMSDKDLEEESKGLWANIHAKRERIKHGSGEKMRKPGSKGAPTASALKKSATEGKGDYVPPKEADYGYEYQEMVKRVGQKAKQQELAKKKQQEKPKDLDESTNQLNNILKLSGHVK